MGDAIEFDGAVAWVFPDHFDVDEIVGADHITTFDENVLRAVCMAGLTPDFAASVQPGDVLVAGRNFGYGHPHHPAMVAMRALGIACVVADSFAPAFERTWLFLGLPLIACPGIAATATRGERIRVSWVDATVRLPERQLTLTGAVPDRYTRRMIEAGGWEQMMIAEATE